MNLSYYEYLKTPEWANVARTVKERAGFRCQVCNRANDLVAHHRSYAHLGDEMNHLGDLTCLCRPCHDLYHDPREVDGRMVCMRMPSRREPANPKADFRGHDANELVYIDAQMARLLGCNSEAIAYWKTKPEVRAPTKGWTKRAKGKVAPLYCLTQAGINRHLSMKKQHVHRPREWHPHHDIKARQQIIHY